MSMFYRPTEIVFGDATTILPNVLEEYGDRVVLITGPHVARQRFFREIVDSLEGDDIDLVVVKRKKNNVDRQLVEDTANEVGELKPRVLVAIGGGGIIDLTKAVSLAITHNGDFWDYRIGGKLGSNSIEDALIPIVSVPTIFGSGAEISPASVIANDITKGIIVSRYMFPKIAIIDPRLPTTVNPSQIAVSGFDAFIHALEAMVSTNSSLLSDSFAEKALQLVMKYLPKAVNNPRDVEVQKRLAVASILASFAIGMAGVGAIHALSNPLSAYFDIPHGLALSMVCVPVIRQNIRYVPEKYKKVLRALGILSFEEKELEEIVVEVIRDFLKAIGLRPQKLPESVSPEDLYKLVQGAYNPDIETNPKKFSEKEILSIYEESLSRSVS